MQKNKNKMINDKHKLLYLLSLLSPSFRVMLAIKSRLVSSLCTRPIFGESMVVSMMYVRVLLVALGK